MSAEHNDVQDDNKKTYTVNEDQQSFYRKNGFILMSDLLKPAQKELIFEAASQIKSWPETKGKSPVDRVKTRQYHVLEQSFTNCREMDAL